MFLILALMINSSRVKHVGNKLSFVAVLLENRNLWMSGDEELDLSSLGRVSILHDRVSSTRDELGSGLKKDLLRFLPRVLKKDQIYLKSIH
jgi:hypothetical protein